MDVDGKPLHGWAFSDDCIFNFRTWREFKIGFQELIDAFEELGLKINLGKTVLIVHPDMMADGVKFFEDCPEHPGFCCQWAQKGEYLKKPFSHYPGAYNLSDWTIASARSLCFSAWEGLASILRACDWRTAHVAVRLVNKYIFAKWSWFSCILEPLQQVHDSCLAMQVSLLLLILRLYVKLDFNRDMALSLNRQRRRAVKCLLTLIPRQQWNYLIFKRKWGFAGHCLRRTRDSLELSLLAASDSSRVRQTKPAPWHNLFSFIGGSCERLGWVEPRPTLDQLREQATNRERWSSVADLVAMQFSLKPVYFSAQHWSSWKQAFRAAQDTEWYMAAYLFTSQQSLWITWLDKEYGCMLLNADQGFSHLLQMLLMYGEFFTVEFIVSPKWADCVLASIPSLTQDIFNDHGVVACWSQAETAWDSEVTHFCGMGAT